MNHSVSEARPLERPVLSCFFALMLSRGLPPLHDQKGAASERVRREARVAARREEEEERMCGITII